MASSSSLPSLSLTAVSTESKADKRAKASGGVEAEVEVKKDTSLVMLYKPGLANRARRKREKERAYLVVAGLLVHRVQVEVVGVGAEVDVDLFARGQFFLEFYRGSTWPALRWSVSRVVYEGRSELLAALSSSSSSAALHPFSRACSPLTSPHPRFRNDLFLRWRSSLLRS